MATKTPTKPKRKQTQTRSWENLTDRRKLRHIENTLDKAITQSLENGSIQSHEDFKACVENYSKASGKAPITVELCVGGDDDEEIRGYRFYLTSDPSHRTSGKYLLKNLEGITDKDENYFTPSNIAEICGFAETELDDLDDDLLDLDEENEEIDEMDDELDDLLNDDFNNELDDLDNLDEEEEISQLRVSESPSKTQTKTSTKTSSKSQTKTQDKTQTNKTATKKSKSREPLDEASRLSATAATNGREINGVNLAGLTGQLATLGIAVGQGVLEQLAAEADEKRLARILKQLQKQNDRVDNLTSRLQEINPESSEFLNPAKSSTTPNFSNTSNSGKSSNPENLPDSTFEASTENNPLAVATMKIGSKVDKLGSTIDPNYQTQPFELDKDASIIEQLQQIEDYLQNISQRLDRLEKVVDRLEKQIAAQQNGSVTESKNAEETVTTNSKNQPENDVLDYLTKRQTKQQQIACADALVGFADVASELFNKTPEDGIPISSNKTLTVKQQGVKQQSKQTAQTGISADVTIALENTQGETLFAGTCTQGQWEITQDNLNADEKIGICKLPQSKSEYALKATAQALVQKFQKQLPDKFNGDEEPTFTWAEKGKPKYDFEIVKLSNGTQLLQGFNPNRDNEQVLDAALVPGEPPEGVKTRYAQNLSRY
jgi:hypothetical protein